MTTTRKKETMATVHDRYQIVDDCCGLYTTEQRVGNALRAARFHRSLHEREGDGYGPSVQVFDVMAHPGAADTWDAIGNVLAHREVSHA